MFPPYNRPLGRSGLGTSTTSSSKRPRSASPPRSPSPSRSEATKITTQKMEAHLRETAESKAKVRAAEKFDEFHAYEEVVEPRSGSPAPRPNERLADYENRYLNWFMSKVSFLADRRVAAKTRDKYGPSTSSRPASIRGRSVASASQSLIAGSDLDPPIYSQPGSLFSECFVNPQDTLLIQMIYPLYLRFQLLQVL